jgi:hypothetical protein
MIGTMSMKGRLGKLVPAFIGPKKIFFLISSIKIFNFILNTRLRYLVGPKDATLEAGPLQFQFRLH